MEEELKDFVEDITIENPYQMLGLTDDVVLVPNADEMIKERYNKEYNLLKEKIIEVKENYGINFSLEQLLGKEDYCIELASTDKKNDTIQDLSDRRDTIEEIRRDLSEKFLNLLKLRKAYSMVANANCRNELLQERIKSNIGEGLITKIEEEKIEEPKTIRVQLDSGDEICLIENRKLGYINFSTVKQDNIKRYRLLRNGVEESSIYLDIPTEKITEEILDILKPILEKEHVDKSYNRYLGSIRRTNNDEKIENRLIYDDETACAISIYEREKEKRKKDNREETNNYYSEK